MADTAVFLYVTTCGSEAEAHADHEAVKALPAAGEIGTDDAAVVTKDAEGRVAVHKHEKSTQARRLDGGRRGRRARHPLPPSLIGTALIGGAAGGLIGHLWKGMSRKDMREIGEMLDEGNAALVVVGRSRLEEVLGRAVTRAAKISEREINSDNKVLEDMVANAAMGAEFHD